MCYLKMSDMVIVEGSYDGQTTKRSPVLYITTC